MRDKQGYLMNQWGEREIYYSMPARERRSMIRASLGKEFDFETLRKLDSHQQVAILNKLNDINMIIIHGIN